MRSGYLGSLYLNPGHCVRGHFRVAIADPKLTPSKQRVNKEYSKSGHKKVKHDQMYYDAIPI